MEEQERTKVLGLGQGEEEGRREIQFIAGGFSPGWCYQPGLNTYL